MPEIHEHTEPPLGEFWEPIQTDRAHRRRLQKLGADKRRAVITIVHNEPVFLPIWLSLLLPLLRARGHLCARQRHDGRIH